jgi:hypothetical protein
MKKVELSEAFVLEAHKAACNDWKQRIEKEVPELFNPKLEKGRWYKQIHEDGNMILSCFQGFGHFQYGFSARGNWSNQIGNAWISSATCKVELATDKEVETALIKEAEKRGFKEGVKYENWIGSNGIIKYNCWSFNSENNSLSQKNNGYGALHYIFDNGKWAEIIENPIPKSLQKAIDKLGKEKILELLK